MVGAGKSELIHKAREGAVARFAAFSVVLGHLTACQKWQPIVGGQCHLDTLLCFPGRSAARSVLTPVFVGVIKLV